MPDSSSVEVEGDNLLIRSLVHSLVLSCVMVKRQTARLSSRRSLLAALLFMASAAMLHAAPAVFPGTTAVGSTSTAITVPVTVTTSGTVSSVAALTGGVSGLDFAISSNGTCTGTFNANATCNVSAIFNPKSPGQRFGAVVLYNGAGTPIGETWLVGTATGPLALFIPGIINTVAGDGSWIYTEDGIAATKATLDVPTGVALDGSGNLFITDNASNRIRRVDAGSDLISTVAGTGGAGDSGDGGLAAAAEINQPSSVAIDGAGNLYIADSGNNAIRVVNRATNLITTIAGVLGASGYSGDGGQATAAKLNTPSAIALDPVNGYLYIADTGNNVVRRVNLASGVISPFAGNGAVGASGDNGPAISASLNFPWGVTVAPDGSVYIADLLNNLVRKVNTAGTITTFAGTGAMGYTGDGGPAGTAELDAPADTVIDPAGNVYIADSGNNVIRKVNDAGTITTIAGSGKEAFAGDGGPATGASLYAPYAMALDGQGDLYFTDKFNQRVREIQSKNAILTYPSMRVDRESATENQALENDGNAVLNISPLTASTAMNSALDPTVTTCPTNGQLDSDLNCIIGAIFYPQTTGSPVTGTITVTSDSPNSVQTLTLSGDVQTLYPSTVNLSVSPTSVTTGAAVTFTATVTSNGGPAPTGTVTFFNGTTALSPEVNLTTAGVATYSTVTLPAGSYSITVQYSGDTNTSTGTSTAVALSVKNMTSTALTSSVNPSNPSQSVTITATVTGATNIGSTDTVTFTDNGTTLGGGPVVLNSAGVATYTGTFAAGTHTLKAVYSGSTYSNTSSATLTQASVSATTTTTLASNNLNPTFGTAVTFTATVKVNAPATGTPANTDTVTFFDGTTVLSTATLTGGVASYMTSALAAGTHSITAQYGGDTSLGYAASTSAAISETVQSMSTTTVVTASSTTPAAGASVTLTATITPATTVPSAPITGTVLFYDNGVQLNPTAVVVNGTTATYATTALAPGSHSITATYSSSTSPSNYAGSTSGPLQITVSQATVTGAITYSPNPAVAGQPEKLIMTLTSTGSTPTGTVTFMDGSTPLGTATVIAGVATLTGQLFTSGSHSITASYGGDTNNGKTSASLTLVVGTSTPAVVLTSSLTPSVAGVLFTLTAKVTTANGTTPTGTVTFFSDGTAIQSGTVNLLSSGVATLSVSTLAVGSHQLKAVYNGDTYNATATSPAITQVVQQATTTTTLIESATNEPQGAGVTFTATVASSTGAIPTGSVQFLDGPTVLATVPLPAGSGSVGFTTSSLIVGQHLIQAVYQGDTNDATSTSNNVTFTVDGVVTVALASNLNPAPAGANVTFTAAVGSGSTQVATGAVIFTDSVTGVLATVPLNSAGVAVLNTSSLTLGNHIITASYGTTKSTPVTEQIQQATTTTSLAVNPSNPTVNSTLTLTATVSGNGGIPDGTVTFWNGSTQIGSGTLSATGVATITYTPSATGSLSLVVKYPGDTNDLGSSSAVQVITVGKGAPTLTIVSSTTSAVQGLPVVFTATLTGTAAAPVGSSITFTDNNGAPMGASPIGANGVATYTTTSLPVGSHSVFASFAGDATDSSATSAAIPVTIQPATSGITLSSNSNPALVGSTITFAMTVTGTGAEPGGTVQLLDGANSVGTASLDNNGFASISTSKLSLGAHTMTANYSGDSSHPKSTSGSIVENVLQPTTTALTSSSNPSLSGTSVTFTAMVAGSGNPVTGTVTLKDGSVAIATVPLGSSGTASFAINSLSPGQHSLVATYSGDSISQTSSSPVVVQTVQDSNTTTVLSTSANPSVAGAALTLTAAVAGKGASPAGTVQFLDGTTVLGTGTVKNGVATYTTSSLTAGQHLLLAIYQGDGNTLTSTSNPVLENIDQNTVVTLTGNVNSTVLTGTAVAPVMIGDTVIFSATVTGSSASTLPTGQVTLSDGSTVIGTGTINVNGVVTFTITTLGLGSHTLTASYAGDAENFPATSAPLTIVVQLHPSKNVLTVSSATVVENQPFSLVATLSGSAPLPPSGTVVFSAGSTTLGSAPLNASGIATLTATLGLGTYNVIATYQGDSVYLGSVSAAAPVNVVPATNFTITLNPSTLQIVSNQHQEIQVTLKSIQNFTDTISLGCVGLPQAATCTFSTDQVTLAANGTQTINVMIDTGSPLTAGSLAKNEGSGSKGIGARGIVMCLLPSGFILGMSLRRRRSAARLLSGLLLALLFVGTMAMTGCGGININGTPAGSYTFDITGIGTKTAATRSAPMSLTVTK
jgi:large repetitive protein